jgi:SAM-dependent methyltransferase
VTPSLAGEERLSAVREGLRGIGYHDTLIRAQFPVWTGWHTIPADLVAFGDNQRHDMTTSTICASVIDAENGDAPLDLARLLACPAAIIARPLRAELWAVTPDETTSRLLSTVAYDDVLEGLAAYGRFLDPHALLAAKHRPQQTALFPLDVGLLAHARRHSADSLTRRIEHALAVASEPVGFDVDAQHLDKQAELVVGAIAALVARDKFSSAASLATPDAVLAHAREAFPGYFDWIDYRATDDQRMLSLLIDLLGGDINFAGLDPSVVSEVYEDALVSEASRRKLGVYYTPPELARRIAAHIPIEELAPEERLVLDPACGSGTLLLAAYDRLQAAVPGDLDPIARHEHARGHLVGADSDQFAVQIAQLALLLHALPAGNGWQLHQEPIENIARTLTEAPTVVFSNPPWRSLRPRGLPRAELADRFVVEMLEIVRPGGLLAMILPASWLTSESSRDIRELLDRSASVFEVWRLPKRTFGSSQLAPCVLFARANETRRPFVFRQVLPHGDWSERFYTREVADESYVSADSDARPCGDWRLGPLHSIQDQLARLPTLNDCAIVQLGPPPRQPVAERGGSGDDLWLRRARDLPVFSEPSEDALTPVHFPAEFSKRSGSADVYRQAKVLVSAMSTEDEPWRLKAGLDLRGVIPRQSLYMVVPRAGGEDRLYALMAVLASSVASAWVGTLTPRLAIRAATMRTLPVPPLDVWESALADVGRRLSSEARTGKVGTEATQQLEAVVADAYALPRTTRRAIASHFAGAVAPEGHIRYPPPEPPTPPHESGTRHYGAVMAVANDQIRLWVPGLTAKQGDWMPLPLRFPGSLCEAGKTFEAVVSEDDLESARFEHQSRAWLDLDELTELVREPA